MLVNHSDTHFNGFNGAGNRDFFMIQIDFSVFQRFLAEKNLHQRGFTGTVFAAQRVNFSSVDAQAHMLISDKTVGIDLGDVFHAQDIPSLLRAAAWGHAFSCGHCITLFLFYKETISGMRSSDRIPQETFTQRLFTERPFLRSSQNRQDPYS